MRQQKMRAAGLCLALLCAGMISGCGASPPASSREPLSQSAPQPQGAWNPVPAAVAALADKNADVDVLAALDSRVTRDDLGVTADIAPYSFRKLIQAILNADLQPYEAGDPALAVPKPFTLAFSYQGADYSYAFSQEKIIANGVDATPSDPLALDGLYESEREGYEGLLTQDIHYLRDDMGFGPEDVASVELATLTMGGEERLVYTGREDIQAVWESLGGLVVWKLSPDAPPNPKTGGSSSCAFTLEDGSAWRYETGLPRSVDSRGGETLYGEVSPNYGGLFDPLYNGSQIGPALYPTMGGTALPACQTALEYGGSFKESATASELPGPDLLYASIDPVVPPGSDTTCILAFSGPDGGKLSPGSLAVSLWREEEETGAWLEAPAPSLSGSALNLPGANGKYYVQVRAQFPLGWAEYLFEYRVSDLPQYLWDIGFGNNEGDVLITRLDSGLALPGGQNRQYVNFLLSLGLTVEAGAPAQALAVEKAFSMAFSQQGRTDVFEFTPQGVTLGGKACVLAHPERVADLYLPFTAETAMSGDSLINHGLRGFLTKETARFTDQYPVPAAELSQLLVVRERPQDYTAYDVTDAASGDLAWLDGILLAREWSEKDYYLPRRFFTSYRITLRDGTVYELGEKLLRDGQETGWYLVYSDLPRAGQLIQGLEGETTTRPQRLPGGVSVDEAGNISFF